ncbi:hypothetical protein [Pseudomonas syringae group genomosp. 3]|uniref:hypothetical protein n=2 Tax=Pseudomonas syringae group genomosp. 3 TaxID=251701 RepID=UPI0011C40286|nr:hypothetical protein [Pseudomonas syringae group genomosp. 3]
METIDMTVKPNIGAHSGAVNNSLTFEGAFDRVSASPETRYVTTGNGTAFTARARLAQRGARLGQPVIVFYSNGTEKARAYACCWGRQTNCNKTHINTYTAAL